MPFSMLEWWVNIFPAPRVVDKDHPGDGEAAKGIKGEQTVGLVQRIPHIHFVLLLSRIGYYVPSMIYILSSKEFLKGS
jgi:hypothetical protein